MATRLVFEVWQYAAALCLAAVFTGSVIGIVFTVRGINRDNTGQDA